MEKRIINPWKYQDGLGYAQAIEVRNTERILYCSGQAAMSVTGEPSTGSMETQLREVIQNLEVVIQEAGYECKDIVRLNVFTTSSAELFECFSIFTDWINLYEISQASTLMEVKGLAFASLKIEMEATLAK